MGSLSVILLVFLGFGFMLTYGNGLPPEEAFENVKDFIGVESELTN